MIIRGEGERVSDDLSASFARIDADRNLDFRAKGILKYCLERSTDFDVTVIDLMRHTKEGRDSIRQGLEDLEKLGYFRKSRKQSFDGKFTGWTNDISADAIFKDENRKKAGKRAKRTEVGKTDFGKSDFGKKAGKRAKRTEVGKTDFGKPDLTNKELISCSYCPDQVSSASEKPRDAREVWAAAFALLDRDINRSSFNTWIRPLSFEFDALNRPCVIVPDDTALFWVSSQWVDVIADALSSATGQEVTKESIIFSIREIIE